MTDPRKLSIQDYTYSLPEKRIAKYPLAERDASKLLVCKKGNIAGDIYRNIANHLPSDSLLIFNKTKVIEARLLFKKQTGGVIEIFCLEPHEQYPGITSAMSQHEKVLWHCLVGGASKWKLGQVLEQKIRWNNQPLRLEARYVEKRSGSFIIEFSWTPIDISFAEVLHAFGVIPLPPYMKRESEESDKTRYQTVYAEAEGSVAAPTAGLHFTATIFNELNKKNVHTDFVTLHVGAGTFKPVKTETMQQHEMHAEWIDISRSVIEHVLSNLGKKIVAVGTTSLRTLESLYWIGLLPKHSSTLQLGQWAPYENVNQNISPEESLTRLLNWMNQKELDHLIAKTQILIAPGYKFKIVNGLVTNFHQPQSTLLLLVAAMIGEDWRKVYDHALQNDFRFLSYGDGCLLWSV
jgi:S-adenosylmethionine:tRNA ribosyltransferase-isomerase